MKPPKECQQPAYHEMHLCILQYIDHNEAAKLSAEPTYSCIRCSLKAREAKNLCSPKKL